MKNPPRGRRDGWVGIPLTGRENQILSMICRGMSRKEIASELRISYRTVRNHMSSVLAKLDVDSSIKAVIKTIGGHNENSVS